MNVYGIDLYFLYRNFEFTVVEYIKCRKNCAAHGEASHCYGRTGWAYSCLMMRNAFIAAGKPM